MRSRWREWTVLIGVVGGLGVLLWWLIYTLAPSWVYQLFGIGALIYLVIRGMVRDLREAWKEWRDYR